MSTDSDEFVEIIPSKSKLAYAITNAAHGLLSGLGLGQINYFYAEKYLLNAELIGIAWLIFAIWNAVNDPLLGILEERTKSKLGRRIPYLRYGPLVYAPLFLLIWFPFFEPGNQWGLFFNLLLMLFLFDTIYSMVGLITYSMPAEMALTQKERGSIMLYSGLIGIIGQVMGFVLPIFYLTGDENTVSDWQILMVITAISCGLIIYVCSYHIKENKWAQRDEVLGFFESIKECVKNKPFLIFEIAIFMMIISQNILMGGVLYLVDYVFVIGEWWTFLYLTPAIVCIVICVIKFPKLVKKYGIKNLFVFGNIFGAIGFALLPFVGRGFEGLSIPILFIGIGLVTMLFTQQPLMADCIDNDEVLTGKRRETTYSGVNALFTKPAISIANWLFFLILAKYGYDKTLDIQPSTVGDGVVLAYSIIPVICAIVMAIVMKYYKLEGPEWEEKKRELQIIHQKKEKAYIEYLKEQGALEKDK